MVTHSNTLAWKIPWTEEPGRLQSMGSLSRTRLSNFTFTHWRRKWQPTPVFLPGESQGQGSLGGLPSMGSHRVRHDWETSLSLPFTFTICSWGCKGYDYCSSINIFSKNQILTSGTYKSYYIWKKGICRCDEVKDFEWTDFWLSRP